MATPAKATTGGTRGDPFDVVVPQILDDPRYAAESARLSAFAAELTRIEGEEQRVALEGRFAKRAPRAKSQEDVTLWARLGALRTAASVRTAGSANAARRGAPVDAAALPPAIAQGLALLAGEPITTPLTPQQQVAELRGQHDAIRQAIFVQSALVEEIGEELTLRYARQLQPAWNALQLEMYRAAQELARCATRVREFRSRITQAGIRSRSDILAMPNVRSPLILGSETSFDSEISWWRRILEARGIL